MASEKNQIYNGEDEEQEDEKMEQFFALIRNFQDARNRRKDELRQREEVTENKKRRSNDNEQSSWVPSFEWGDFTEEIRFRRAPFIFPTPYNNKDDKQKQQQQEEDDGLDLKLTL